MPLCDDLQTTVKMRKRDTVIASEEFNADEKQTSHQPDFYRIRRLTHTFDKTSNRLIVMKEKRPPATACSDRASMLQITWFCPDEIAQRNDSMANGRFCLCQLQDGVRPKLVVEVASKCRSGTVMIEL